MSRLKTAIAAAVAAAAILGIAVAFVGAGDLPGAGTSQSQLQKYDVPHNGDLMQVVGGDESFVATIDENSVRTEADGTVSVLMAMFYTNPLKNNAVIVAGRITIKCGATLSVRDASVLYGITEKSEVIPENEDTQTFAVAPEGTVIYNAARAACALRHELTTRSL